jgi:tetratricopeptide (TPR) repeat protein
LGSKIPFKGCELQVGFEYQNSEKFKAIHVFHAGATFWCRRYVHVVNRLNLLTQNQGDVFHLYLKTAKSVAEEIPKSVSGESSNSREREVVSCMRHVLETFRKRRKVVARSAEDDELDDAFQVASDCIARYGDTAEYMLLDTQDQVFVGDVVACVVELDGSMFATKKPGTQQKVVRWGIVANYCETPGFSSILPQPKKLIGSRPAHPFVAVATHGIVVVNTQGPCRNTCWLTASGDGFAIAEEESSNNAQRLGKVIIGVDGLAFVAVSMQTTVLRPPAMDEHGWKAEDAEKKARGKLDKGNALFEKQQYLDALKFYKMQQESASNETRSMMYLQEAKCYLLLGNEVKAGKAVRKAVEVLPTNSR